MSADRKGKTNVGFKILETRVSSRDSSMRVALGYKVDMYGDEWVTWMYDPAQSGYFWGHYSPDASSAVEDYRSR